MIARTTHCRHGRPFLAKNFTNLAGAHGLILCRNLGAASASKDHERVHRALGGPVGIQALGGKGTVFCKALSYKRRAERAVHTFIVVGRLCVVVVAVVRARLGATVVAPF